MATRRNDPLRMNIIKNFQNNLNSLMESHGLDSKDLHEYTGIALSDLTKYRNPVYNVLPGVTEIAKICNYFKVSFDFMIGLDPSGRFTKISDEESKLLNLYNRTSDRDKMLIQSILSHYNDNNESEE